MKTLEEVIERAGVDYLLTNEDAKAKDFIASRVHKWISQVLDTTPDHSIESLKKAFGVKER